MWPIQPFRRLGFLLYYFEAVLIGLREDSSCGNLSVNVGPTSETCVESSVLECVDLAVREGGAILTV